MLYSSYLVIIVAVVKKHSFLISWLLRLSYWLPETECCAVIPGAMWRVTGTKKDK